MKQEISGAASANGNNNTHEGNNNEAALLWTRNIMKSHIYDSMRKSILKSYTETTGIENKVVHQVVDVTNFGKRERQQFINSILRVVEEDNEIFLTKLRSRMDEARINLPTIEVRFKNLTIEADCITRDRVLPSLPNATRNIVETALSCFGIKLAKRTKVHILQDVSGMIKPSRMTLLLGPPACGKTTLLLALAGRLNTSLKASGELTYNGHQLNEFVPQKTSAYVSQNDVHVPEMTVGETLDFSARCQGIGLQRELLEELLKKEEAAGIIPDTDVDLFMKAIAVEGVSSSLITDYILKILGLDACRDTIVGDGMRRGISGGQMKRVTAGEMMVGPTRTLFMDEISTGLDSSTTFQVVNSLKQIVHLTESTVLISLLQPAPEIFDLFDDIILLSEGQTVYSGPREHIIEFFETCGFRCPERKGIADFLQEVTSEKDQEQYWGKEIEPYQYITPSEFADRFKNFHDGVYLQEQLSVPYEKKACDEAALVFNRHSVPYTVLLKTNFEKEWLLIKRNSFFYVFKTVQIIVVALIASTVFLRTRMRSCNEEDGAVYMGALVFGMILNTFNGFVEMSLIVERLPVIYKHRDLLFHPPWAFTLPKFLLGIPISLFETVAWTVTTYYTIGFAPEASRFFKHLLWVFCIQQMAAGLFRLISGICRTMVIAGTGGSLILLLVFLLGGFILPAGQIPSWWKWGYWISPLSYGYNAVTVNEMFAPRWTNKLGSDNGTRLGVAVLQDFDIFPEEKWYWIGIVALMAFTILFNLVFTYALTYLSPFVKVHGTTSEEKTNSATRHSTKSCKNHPRVLSDKKENTGVSSMLIQREDSIASKSGMVLPFVPLAMSFENVNYYVEIPTEVKEKGAIADRIQLIQELTGAFRPGVLTALMGVSGAGKTTLMDVLAGRKTRGHIEGDIRISGFPKKQETFARISGYCEQNDVNSPQVTVHESLKFSAFLRLPFQVNKEDKMIFVEEVMNLVELEDLKDSIVGIPGVTGLSTEQRKRLTIAVELVANPSIIFMDEPTSGLDARAAAIVMRTVRNTVDTGRTVVCTIHQPGIDIFEAFDELLLLKRGGRMMYAGPLGKQSKELIDYFEAIPGVPKIKEQSNPATWMLEVSSESTEVKLGIDFGDYYKSTTLYQQNKKFAEDFRNPPRGAKDLQFPNRYSQSTWGQFKICFWKQHLSYWRNPDYNLSRFIFTFLAAILVGSIFWRIGTQRQSSTDLLTIIGAMYAAVLFVGINNATTVQPVVATERTVFYREMAAGMYSPVPYAMAQVIAEIPYIFFQTTYYTIIVYFMVSFELDAAKFFWFFFVNFLSFLYFTYYGMMVVAMTPNLQVAIVLANAFYYLFNLFSGFFIPAPRIPVWWIWYYWICPIAWTVYGLIVSQYGDMEDTIKVPGTLVRPMIKTYIQEHFGYNTDFMGPVVAVLVGFTLLFAFMYAYGIKKLNFQNR